jgi:glycyl-tRNA synthetase beta chain
MTTKNLLVELLVEELPPKELKKLGEAFGSSLYSELQKANALDDDTVFTTFASPRRLTVHITNVLPIAAAKPVKVRLMPVSVALDSEGAPTPALIKKFESLGLGYLLKVGQSVWNERISREGEGKNESLFHTDVAAGLPLKDNLQIALSQALTKLPIPKMMTYQLADGWTDEKFVRPAHGLVALHGAEIVPIKVLGLNAGRETQGHRFEAKSNPIMLKNADSYAQQLKTDGAVIASYEERCLSIIRQLREQAKLLKSRLEVEPVAGLFDAEAEAVLEDNELIQEVTALVEHPNVLVGQFEKEFLEVPPECLILTMKANQKYFPLLDASGKLTNKFLIVSNIRPADASKVIGGNERVVRPRLADAKFFFDQDRKKTLESRVEGLSKVVYHNKLGTQGQRVERVRAIAKAIGKQLGGDALAAQADQAAMLAKADLLTNMVGEFPELQGIMGRYYAQHDGLSDEIAYAIEDHYKPCFSGDELPRNMVGICVALADKLETLVGMFGIGQIPTGDKDPFALRRHALGVIRLLIEQDLPLELDVLLSTAIDAFGPLIEHFDSPPSAEETLLAKQRGVGNITTTLRRNFSTQSRELLAEFIFERLAGSLKEQGYSPQEVDAVLSLRPQRLCDVTKRLAAVRAFAALPEAAALAAANKRVGNILKKAEGTIGGAVNQALLKATAEQALHEALSAIAPRANAAFERGDYTASLQALAGLRVPVDAFFDSVMVNTEDASLRTNRLALLKQLHAAMNRVADISKLAA